MGGRSLLSLLVVAIVATVAVADDVEGQAPLPNANNPTAAATNDPAATSGPFRQVSAPRNVKVHLYNFGLPHAVTHLARMNITIDQTPRGLPPFNGTIVIALFGHVCPKTVANFVALCNHEHGFGYVNSTFHRVLRNFLIQGGDFESNDGFGGHSIYNNKGRFEDENYAVTHSEGAVAMAAEGAEENGSQFYILGAADAAFLDGVHVVFGHVVTGFRDVVRKVLTAPLTADDAPKSRVVISACSAGPHDEEARVPREVRIKVLEARAAAAATDPSRQRRGEDELLRRRSKKHRSAASASISGADGGDASSDDAGGDAAAAAAEDDAATSQKPHGASDDPSNRRLEGPRRPFDPPHRSQRHRDDMARRRAEFEAREHERREKRYGERGAHERRDTARAKAEKRAAEAEKAGEERSRRIDELRKMREDARRAHEERRSKRRGGRKGDSSSQSVSEGSPSQ